MEFLVLGFLVMVVTLGPWVMIVILYGRLNTLERKIALLTMPGQSAPQPAPQVHHVDVDVSSLPTPSIPIPPAVPPPPVPRARSKAEWEMLVGGKLLNRIGAAAIVLASVFFLSYAFEEDLIPPIGRVLIGLLAGSVLLWFGRVWMRKGLAAFSQGLVGAGIVILYLSAYATYGFYDLLPQQAAFLLMAAVTCIAAWRSLEHRSLATAIAASVGGLTTPIWLSTGEMNTVGLFGYLCILSIGAYALALYRPSWRITAFVTASGVSLWWFVWANSAGAFVDSLEGSTLALLTIVNALGYHCLRDSEDRPKNLLDIYTMIVAVSAPVLAISMSLANEAAWIRIAFVSLAGALFFVALEVRRLRAMNEEEFQGAVATGGILTLALLMSVPENSYLKIVSGSAATLVGYLYILRFNLKTPFIGAMIVSSLFMVSYVLLSVDAFDMDLRNMPVLNYRALTYIVAMGSVIAVSRLSKQPTTWAGVIESAAWFGIGGLFFTEARDIVQSALSQSSFAHASYAAASVGLATAALVATTARAFVTGHTLDTLRNGARVALGVAGIYWLVIGPWFVGHSEYVPLLNVRVGTALVLCACSLLALYRAQSDVILRYIASGVLGTVLFATLSTEITWSSWLEYWNTDGTASDAALNQAHLFLSSVWIAYGIAVMGFGFIRRQRLVRIGGIALLALAILKVFLYDLSSLEQPYRIVSFIALGVILIGASYLYTRYRTIIIGTDETETTT